MKQLHTMKNIPSLNFHLYEPCNMRCGFCFATFQAMKKTILPKGHLPIADITRLMHEIGESKLFQKINFAGGEPTLHPHLIELIKIAKSYQLTTSIVTNGTKLTARFLQEAQGHLDWVALSVDSLVSATNLEAGRAITGKTTLLRADYEQLASQIQANGYKLKINTVVHTLNYQEDFTSFIAQVQPQRWKILQVLKIEGENEKAVQRFLINDVQFQNFVLRHALLENITEIAPETNEQIKGSYLMINPAGQFFENIEGKYMESAPILVVGVENALAQVRTDFDKFVERKGIYAW
jgi:radical S-adenosyl methionine domain-containing protein 2